MVKPAAAGKSSFGRTNVTKQLVPRGRCAYPRGSAMASPVVVVRDLRKSYGAVRAVTDVTFAIEPGEIFGLLGPNGAGKTTTLECLIGLREPDAGQLEVCGLDAVRHAAAVKQKIGVALQSTALPEKITPREALAMFGAFYEQHMGPDLLLEKFALTEKADARFDTLSGGQRQRLALALAFVNRPEIVLLDEPTTGLDPQARRELHAAITQMKADGYTVLFTTHYLDEAERLCDRVAIIDHGRIVATGAPRDLIAKSSGRQTVTLVTSRPLDREQFMSRVKVYELTGDGTTVRFQTGDPAGTLAAIAQWLSAEKIDLLDLHVRKASLEDVFLGLTRSDEVEAGG
jgi:ABC-2 type transport system ATP-binding protein